MRPWLRGRQILGVLGAAWLCAACGAPQYAPESLWQVASLRRAVAAQPKRAALVRQLALAELFAPGGDARRAPALLARAGRLGARDGGVSGGGVRVRHEH
ncbi:MAG: hypothetical protein ACPGUV_14930, partial [Polyangiales bacterium]